MPDFHGRTGVADSAATAAQRQAEETLLKAGALQSAFINSANFSCIATDAKGVIQIFNVGAPAFLQNCRKNVIAMQQALESGDLQTVEFLGHGTRGAGGMFDFPEITEIGAALQESAESADFAGARKWAGELSSCLDRSMTTAG